MQTIADTVRITVGAVDYASGGQIHVRIESILVSDSAAPFEQDTDFLEIVEGVYGAPTLVVATAGTNTLYIYRYLSGQEGYIGLPLVLAQGCALASQASSVYVVYGGNRPNFTLVDVAAGDVAALPDLPVNSTNSILVYDPARNAILYLPDIFTGNTFYIYDIGLGAWTGTLTIPIPPPLYACTVAAYVVACLNETHIGFYNTTSGSLLAYRQPVYSIPVGLLYDDARDWYIVVYSSGDVYVFTAGYWYRVEPPLPPLPTTPAYSILTAQDPDRLFFIRLLTRELYSINKNNLQLTLAGK